jgi:hypothetical protein
LADEDSAGSGFAFFAALRLCVSFFIAKTPRRKGAEKIHRILLSYDVDVA